MERRSTDRVLDNIDDVLTDWDGSDDSARWSPTPKVPTVDPEQLAAAFRPVMQAMRQTVERLSESFRLVAEFAATPQGQDTFTLSGAEASRADPEQGCNCLCAKNHPGEWPCLGFVPTSEVRTVRFGNTDVPMCPPCAGALSPGTYRGREVS
jgi:hypothetical protein